MPQDGYHATHQLLDRNAGFTGLVVSNDYLALGAILALNECGLRIPEDISIVGFDDTPESAYYTPPLTTIAQPRLALGQMAMKMALDLLNDQDAQDQVLPCQLVVRESTR